MTDTLATVRQSFGEEITAVHGCLKDIRCSAKIEIGETGEEQSQEHAHHYFLHQGDCLQIIRHGRPNSQFRTLL
jgi:hypothetical protein